MSLSVSPLLTSIVCSATPKPPLNSLPPPPPSLSLSLSLSLSFVLQTSLYRRHPPGSLCLQDCLLCPGLHVAEGGSQGLQLEPQLRRHCPHVEGRLHHPQVNSLSTFPQFLELPRTFSRSLCFCMNHSSHVLM